MKQQFERALAWTAGQPLWKIFLLAIGTVVVNNMLWPILVIAKGNSSIWYGAENLLELSRKWYLPVLIGPVVETLLFQFLLLHLFLKYLPPYLAVVVNAVLFALMHSHNVFYILAAFAGGYVFAFIFYDYGYKRKHLLFAFCYVALIHILVNSASFLINYLTE